MPETPTNGAGALAAPPIPVAPAIGAPVAFNLDTGARVLQFINPAHPQPPFLVLPFATVKGLMVGVLQAEIQLEMQGKAAGAPASKILTGAVTMPALTPEQIRKLADAARDRR